MPRRCRGRAICYSIVLALHRPQKLAGESDLDLASTLLAAQNESTAFSESLARSSALPAILKTGSGAYPRAPADKTAVTREDFSSPLGAFLTQIPKLDSKKFCKRVPPKP